MAKRNGTNKQVTSFFLKFLIVLVFGGFFGMVVYKGTAAYFQHGEIFNIKTVEMDPYLQFIDSRLLNDLVGKNIFEADLRRVYKRLKVQYPDIDQLRVYRKFPNKIYVAAPRREPVAQMKISNKDVLLDKNGIVLSFRVAAGQLPIVRTSAQYSDAVFGRPLRSPEISAALEIIKSLRANEHLRSYVVPTIDVTNLSKIIFTINDNLNIIIDRENIRQKIDNLGVLLSQGNLDLKNVNYIDLRFKEPILGKNEKG